MIYRIRHVRMDDDGHICWEDSRRKEFHSQKRDLLGQIITQTVRGEVRFYRVEAAKLEEKEIVR